MSHWMLSQRSSHHRRLSQTSRLAHSMLEQQGFHGFVRPHVPGWVNAARSGGKPLALIHYPQKNNRCMCKMLNKEWNSEVALYAPLHFVVYEDEAGKTFVAYDTFVSLLAQYQCEGV